MNVEIKFSNTREYLCKTNKNLWQVKEKYFTVQLLITQIPM